ncbi:unnamed protein product [Sympodiomycopsis kandeliae]
MVPSPAVLATVALAAASMTSAAIVRRDTVISSSQRIPDTNAKIGTVGQKTTINSGVNYWLSGFSTHNIYGSLDNSGSLTISQTDSVIKNPGGQSVYMGTGSLNNRGTILLNDVAAASAPTYNWQLDSFDNSGTIQWCGRGDTGGSTYNLQCNSGSGTCNNNGLIVYEQVNNNFGTAAKWLSPSKSITNNGGFLMRSTRFDLYANMQGSSGCLMIENDATLYLQDTIGSSSPALDGQSVSFTADRGVLHLESGVHARNSLFGAQIYGFGGAGNAIEFESIVTTFSYANSILTVNFLGLNNYVQLKIGSGYDATKFVKKTQANKYGSYNAIVYNGQAPRSAASAPGSCQKSAPACAALPATGFPGQPDAPTTTSSSVPTTTTAAPTTSTSVPTTSTAAPTTSTAAPTTSTAAPTTSTSAPTTTADPTTSTSAPTTSTSAPTTTAAPSVSSTAVPSVTTTAAPSLPTDSFQYGGQSLGCFRDDAGFNGPRSLPSARISEGIMTQEYCANHCGQQGFKYSGTEYGSECYCGASLPSTKAENCNVQCAGNPSEMCGGSWALNVFDNTNIKGSVTDANYQSLGCFADNMPGRTFQGYSFSAANMTQAVCAKECSSRNFAFSGTEYSSECYCASYEPVVKSDQCNMTCSGSNAEFCGGPNALTVLKDSQLQAQTQAPSCPNIPAGYAVCKEGQTVVSGKCVTPSAA